MLAELPQMAKQKIRRLRSFRKWRNKKFGAQSEGLQGLFSKFDTQSEGLQGLFLKFDDPSEGLQGIFLCFVDDSETKFI